MSLKYIDPDGNFVELQSDNFGGWKRSTEWMRMSPDFRSKKVYEEYATASTSRSNAAAF